MTRKVGYYLILALTVAFFASAGLQAAGLLKQAAARMAHKRARAHAEVTR